MPPAELPPQDTPSEQTPIGITCMIEGLLLAGFLVFLHEALQPDFKGGGFIRSCLVLSTAFLIVVFARDVWIAMSKHSQDHAAAAASAWRVIGLSFGSMIVLLGSTLVFGMVVAMPAVAFLILRWHMGLPLWRAAAIGLFLGAVIPVAFSRAVGMPLWAGMMPEVIPHWVGGGILPSL
jgi:hypothetical protein